ncbi:TVP38/TMEM64 family protein [Maridesulfovibrio hydrothermalis]|uniref:TVP38/TMEM64 family membrane protein n=1 Tax=Maridesulfovibrio hydrothermalis AM13 = DSM 14728 TaxID=1121451 RepID=L0RDV7_9BACT|nr:VTT domain-containing protein [Maridesulfovibrio hydrothermalis]CCO24919.1 SNARE associated Golgi protein [Maridesulfovibrio hydrothermalis AM13 = DSM 14728]
MTSSRSDRKVSIKALVKGLAMLGVLALVVYLFRYAGLADALDTKWIDDHVRSRGMVGVLTYVGLAAFLSAVGFPRQIICFMGGYAYGFALGALLGTVGTGLGCACAFVYSRLVGRSFIKRKFGARIQKVDNFLSRSPFNMALTIRFFPLGSNFVTNILAGVTSIPALPFILGSTIGYLPQNIVFALFGSGVEVSSTLRMVMAVILFVISTLLGFKIYQKYRNQAEAVVE